MLRRVGLGLGLLALGLFSAQAAPVLEGRVLRYEDGPRVVWQRTFPATLGDLSGPLEVQGVVYLGAGPVVYALNAAGALLGRADLPGLVTSLDASGGAVRATVQEGGLSGQYSLETGGGLNVRERVVLPPNVRITGFLARVADATPRAALDRAAADDPTNPFLALRRAQATRDPYLTLSEVRRALSGSVPFPAWVQLAARLDGAGFPAAADAALGRALKDAASRGIDPDIALSRSALFAYGNPSGYVGTLLEQNRLARAEAWMRYLRELHPRFEGGPALYERYARILDTQGRSGEAEEWRQFTRTLRAGTLYNLGPQGLRSVRDAARLATLSLGLSLAAALLTLLARAWGPQGAQTAELGGRFLSWLRHPLSRARRAVVAYASWSERLLLTLLAAALILAVGGWQWANLASAALRSPALNLGTYGGWSAANLPALNLRPGPDAALLGGLAAQFDGEDASAREQYLRALPDACAQNNLGVIAQNRGDQAQARERYRAALAARPELAAAAFNLGLNPSTPGTAFQRLYRPGQPRLCLPDARSLTRAVTGDLSVTLGQFLRQPQGALSPGPGRSVRLGLLLILTTLLGTVLAFSLLLPRAPLTLAQSRPPLYRLLGALLPGTSLLDSAWGGVLLLAWSAALAALAPRSGLIAFPDLAPLTQGGAQGALLALLLGTYALNTLVFVAAELRHSRRLRREAAAGA
ncbi:hypothetical protein [Deinococcus koreensis]|uniref:Tetratricopeptide repeat-containing protein n=1 Tax=Deinococcus koreensis TaxID=2054903 RepID=A0A2K3UWS4_9DEIO|nr:hypothetical protein [Deinococcus koreensis]PNY80987.1 hypothetical protein CVO96_06005 [Deinococcus koreensis]